MVFQIQGIWRRLDFKITKSYSPKLTPARFILFHIVNSDLQSTNAQPPPRAYSKIINSPVLIDQYHHTLPLKLIASG